MTDDQRDDRRRHKPRPSQPRPPIATWLTDPLTADVARAVDRLARCPGVARIALMPDVHLSEHVCVGTVLATIGLLYPAAIGGDIGCGMAAIAFDAPASAVLATKSDAPRILHELKQRIPANRHHRPQDLPEELDSTPLSHPSLESIKHRDGRVQFATLGGGNHFLEFQSDDDSIGGDGRLWLMLHTGSRGVGQAIRDHHLARARGRPLAALDADSPDGRDYLADMAWATAYAAASRRAIVDRVASLLAELLAITPLPDTYIDCHHNFVRQETHFDQPLYVHRKGAISAEINEPGITPGSMGTHSFHVAGRGNPAALHSSAHGAGRAMSRGEARQRISPHDLSRQLDSVYFYPTMADALREEAPAAYKPIDKVMRAQRDLTRIVRKLRPVLSYKG
ncbi:MAG TPA: RtcB family protein, partial [Tepidisphaeraceae bacterium]|nr:RtcB family protein [Tepidisphaeraceae bacterium]